MSQGMRTNVSISSLLDSNSSSSSSANNNTTGAAVMTNLKKLQTKTTPARQVHTPISQLVSKFQTSFDPSTQPVNGAGTTNSLSETSKQQKQHSPQAHPNSSSSSTGNKVNMLVGANNSKSRTLSLSPSPSISAQVKKFQTQFQVEPVVSPQPKSKTSINSIINMDDDFSSTPPAPAPAPAPAAPTHSAVDNYRNYQNTIKRKKQPSAQNNSSTEAKKRKPNTPDVDNSSPTTASKSNLPQSRTKETDASSKSLDSAKKLPKTDTAPPKPVKLAAPTVINLLNPIEGEDAVQSNAVKESPGTDKSDNKTNNNKSIERTLKEKEQDKDKDKAEPPIVALNIPLLDPKDPQPGKAEVVVNVLKLAEDKYGWSVMHPKAKSAIEVIDDMIDDEDDEDDDDDLADDQDKAPAPPQSNNSVLPVAPRGKELTEEQLVRQHEIRMIRKVGKYDFEDPFIDDVELQMEEDISSTKEGFFVYWGPLVDDRSSNKKAIKKK
ncbi:HPC2 [Candida metapsilosis]|uniref:HPC2 n=1 Tax=Candida metapsilosis TaxID=273372 RepID=A0A8H7ZHH2_9ASCO|nr:HPC2 [Candida metapsilosis]